MKKIYLILIAILLISCTQQEDVCECTGVFRPHVLATNDIIIDTEVYCKSGELVDQTLITGTVTRPALIFLGCRPE